MNTSKIWIKLKTQENSVVNSKAEFANLNMDSERNEIPDAVFVFHYKIDGTERILNLRRLFEIDVSELTELTLSNLRTQLEQISSIRMTLARAHEQLMEDFDIFKINYEIWWGSAQESGRKLHWDEQTRIQKQYDLAKSGMKAPTLDDVRYAYINSVGGKVDYEEKEIKKLFFERRLALYNKVDSILNSREFALNKIIDSRMSKAG